MKKIFLLLSFIFIISCEKDPIIYTLTIQSNPVEGGTFSPTSPQDLSSWCVSNVTNYESFSTGSNLSNANMPKWGTCP